MFEFRCLKNALISLNILYLVVSLILISVAAVGKASGYVGSIPVIGGIIACGVFLFIIAVFGLVGAVKHHQVCLFFYVVILFLLFLVQFAIACACLAFNKEQQSRLFKEGWKRADDVLKANCQRAFDCCGMDTEFQNATLQDGPYGHPACKLTCCGEGGGECCTSGSTCPCSSCWDRLEGQMDSGLKVSGGVGLFFSFTEMVGVWLALRFRNSKDPALNPNDFL